MSHQRELSKLLELAKKHLQAQGLAKKNGPYCRKNRWEPEGFGSNPEDRPEDFCRENLKACIMIRYGQAIAQKGKGRKGVENPGKGIKDCCNFEKSNIYCSS